MSEPDMEYLFVYGDNGWWLKITTIEQLTEYHKKTNNRFAGALDLYWSYKKNGKNIMDAYMEMPIQERIDLMQNRDFKYLQCAIIQAEKIKGTIFDGFRSVNIEAGMNELDTLKEYGAVFINSAGGHTHEVQYTQFCRRKEFVFPDFKESDIRITTFKGGTHYYAYIGDMQVRNGEKLKYDTYNAAKNAALKIIRKEA